MPSPDTIVVIREQPAQALVGPQGPPGFGLIPTDVKTGPYTAAPSDLVLVDTTAGNVAVTLPTSPPAGTIIAVKHVKRGGTNIVTVHAGGRVFNATGGPATLELPLLNQDVLVQYGRSPEIWYVLADDLTLPDLDGRFDPLGAAAAAQTASQPLDADLTAIAALNASAAGAIATDGAGWVKKTYAQFKAALGLDNVTNDAQLKASQLDVDGTFGANSDTRVPSQKAAKAYVDAETARALFAESLLPTSVSELVDVQLADLHLGDILQYHAPTSSWKNVPDVRFNVKTYGAVGDGATDDTAAIVAAIAACSAAGGGKVWFPVGAYRVTTEVDVPSGVRLLGAGKGVSTIKLAGGNITVVGSVGAEVNVTAPSVAGATTLTIASTTGRSAGEWIRVISCINSQSADAGIWQLGSLTSDKTYLSEFIQIESVDSSTQLSLVGPLLFPYATTAGADSGTRTTSTIRPVTFVTDAGIADLTVTASGNTIAGGLYPAAVQFKYAKDCAVKGCSFDISALGMSAGCVTAWYSLDCFVDDLALTGVYHATDAPAANPVKSVSSTNFNVFNTRVQGGNQGVDFTYQPNSATEWGGPSIAGGVFGGRFAGQHTDAITNHYGCYGQTFRDVYLRKGLVAYGIRVRAPGTTVEGCFVVGNSGGNPGIYVNGMALFGTKVRYNFLHSDALGIWVLPEQSNNTPGIGPVFDGQAECSIEGNTFINCAQFVAVRPPTANGGKTAIKHHISIRRNYGRNPTSDAIYVQAYANGTVVEDNVILGVPSGKAGIKFDANIVDLRIGPNEIWDVNAAGYAVRGPGTGTFLTDSTTFPGGDATANLYISPELRSDAIIANQRYQVPAAAAAYWPVPISNATITSSAITGSAITKRVQSLADAATLTPDCSNYDAAYASALSQAATIANPTGTPTPFQTLVLRIRSSASQGLTWDTQYRSATDIALPAATTGSSKWDYVAFLWNAVDSTWDLVGLVTDDTSQPDARYQPVDDDLTAIAALDASTAGAIASDGAGWVKKTYAQFKTALALAKADVGLGSVDNTADASKPVSTAQQAAIDAKVTANAGITGATKTKITYDAKGLVTSGADATTADIADSTNRRYVTDAQQTVIGNTSGANTGDQTTVSGNAGTATKLAATKNIDGQAFDGSADITVIAPGTHAATSKATPVDADELSLVDSAASNVLKKLTWANLKATLKTYFDTLYQAKWVVASLADAATLTPDCAGSDVVKVLALSQAAQVLNPTGTQTSGKPLLLRIKSTASQGLTWDTQYRGSTDIALPASTTGSSKWDYMMFLWNSDDSKWDIVGLVRGF